MARRKIIFIGPGTEIWGPYSWCVYWGTLTFQMASWTGSIQGPTRPGREALAHDWLVKRPSTSAPEMTPDLSRLRRVAAGT